MSLQNLYNVTMRVQALIIIKHTHVSDRNVGGWKSQSTCNGNLCRVFCESIKSISNIHFSRSHSTASVLEEFERMEVYKLREQTHAHFIQDDKRRQTEENAFEGMKKNTIILFVRWLGMK